MSASITIFPLAKDYWNEHHPDWCWDMEAAGYEVRLCRLAKGHTVTAWPSETARSNAGREKMPRYKHQYHGTQPDGAA